MTEFNHNKKNKEQNDQNRDKKEIIDSILLKIVVLGDPAVGKTSLIKMYTENDFREDYWPTLGVNIVNKGIILENPKVENLKVQVRLRLVLWDVTGQIEYEISRKEVFQKADGALLVYDITRHHTLQNIEKKWLEDFKKYAKQDEPYILIGNKLDLEDSRKISTEDGKVFSKLIRANGFVETSAKFGENVENAFKKLVDNILKNRGVDL